MIKGTLTITNLPRAEDLLMLGLEERMARSDFHIWDKHLRDKKIHLFIASQDWEKVVLHLYQGMDTDMVPHVVSAARNVEMVFYANLDTPVVDMLCKLYPDKQGKLRRYHMLGKDVSAVFLEGAD